MGRSDRDGKGTDRAGKGPKSKRAAQQQAKASETPIINWRKAGSYAAVIALLGIVYWATQVDGGAPQRGIDAAKGATAMFTDWRLSAEHPDGSQTTLCSLRSPCDIDELQAADQDNATCTLRGDVWLASKAMPVVLRGVDIEYNASAISGNYIGNSSQAQLRTDHADGSVRWDNGWWWRPQKEHVPVNVPVPCVAHTLHVNLFIDAKGFWGKDEAGVQRATLMIHTAYLDALRRDREGPVAST